MNELTTKVKQYCQYYGERLEVYNIRYFMFGFFFVTYEINTSDVFIWVIFYLIKQEIARSDKSELNFHLILCSKPLIPEKTLQDLICRAYVYKLNGKRIKEFYYRVADIWAMPRKLAGYSRGYARGDTQREIRGLLGKRTHKYCTNEC